MTLVQALNEMKYIDKQIKCEWKKKVIDAESIGNELNAADKLKFEHNKLFEFVTDNIVSRMTMIEISSLLYDVSQGPTLFMVNPKYTQYSDYERRLLAKLALYVKMYMDSYQIKA